MLVSCSLLHHPAPVRYHPAPNTIQHHLAPNIIQYHPLIILLTLALVSGSCLHHPAPVWHYPAPNTIQHHPAPNIIQHHPHPAHARARASVLLALALALVLALMPTHIFAHNFLNNGPILINFFLFESSWSPLLNGGMQYYVVLIATNSKQDTSASASRILSFMLPTASECKKVKQIHFH